MLVSTCLIQSVSLYISPMHTMYLKLFVMPLGRLWGVTLHICEPDVAFVSSGTSSRCLVCLLIWQSTTQRTMAQ